MKKLLLLLVLLFISSFTFAQSLLHSKRTSYYTYIYQLKEAEAKKIYRKDLYVVDQSYFHTAIDSFPTGSQYHKTLPYGHYLFTYAEGGDLVYELKPVENLRLQLLNNKVDLSVLLTDSTGKPIVDAAIYVRNRRIPYNKQAGTYLLKRTYRKGLVSVRYQGVTSFHHIDTKNKQPFLRKVKNRIIYTRPVYWAWKPFKDVVRSIRYGYPEGWIRGLARMIHPDDFNDHTNKYRGYMAFNKPLYMPGDTVKFKAFILKRRGKPIGNELQVVLNTAQGRKMLTTLQPYRKGGYFYEFVLHDSLQLQLDRSYGIALEKKKYRSVMYDSFKLEEYELKSNTFSLRSDKTTHYTGTPVSLFAQGKDENDLPIADATVQLTLMPSQVLHYAGTHTFVKDTLWQHQQKLDPIGETKITLPDSIFPATSFEYTVSAVFLNASNERHTENLNLTYFHHEQEIKLDLDKDTLLAEYLVAGKSKPVPAQLTTWTKGQVEPITSAIQLPAKKVLNPYVYRYEYKVDSLTKSLFLAEQETLLQCYSQRTSDSIYIWIENPRQLPFYYTIYRKNRAIARGNGNTLNFTAKVTTPANYFISLQYIWAGEVQEKEYGVTFGHNKLNIAVIQPMVVKPGQKATIDIVVTDADGSPVKNVDLTAYAITRKFQDASAPEVPYLGKTYKSRKSIREFDLDHKLDGKAEASYPLDWQYWNPEMGLDSIAYYHFLYPAQGIFQQYVSTSDSLCQFAPFVVQNGRLLPVYLLYLDNRLVYYKDTDVTQRYSFWSSRGYHSLKLRTIDKEIVMDSVLLKPAAKMVLSVNLDFAHKNVNIKEVKREYSYQEQQVLNRYVKHVQRSFASKEAYLKQGNFIQPLTLRQGNQHWYYHPSNTLIAGIYTPSPMQFVLREGFTTSFIFEPLYAYEFGEQLLKMRSINPKNFYKYPLTADYNKINPNFQEQPYQQKEIDSLWAWQKEIDLPKIHKYSYARTTTNGFGRLIIQKMNLPDSAETRIKAILLFRKEEPNFLQVYPVITNTFHQLSPGDYKVVLLLYFIQFIETDYFQVKSGGSNFLTINNLAVQQPNKFSLKAAEMILKEAYSLQEEKKNLQEVKESFYDTYNITPTGDFTHLITGQVTDTDGSTLPGVNVVVKGTSKGTITDMHGQYHLYVPLNGVLVFSYIGFTTEEILIGTKSVIDAQMQGDVKSLSEVVVVGYSVQNKVNLTASVSAISTMQGRVAGMQMTDSIDLRGVASLDANNKPLLVVNGVPFNGDLADIDPALITKSQVLKGEAAKALYGSRASNGVILITTSLFPAMHKTDSLTNLAGLTGDASQT